MNRYNLGNVITNGMQILSVGATTAAKTLGRADQTLNNLSDDEKSAYYKMKADKIRDEINRYNTGGESATQHLSKEELTDYRKKQADDIRKKTYGKEEESVDAIMEGSEKNLPKLKNNSPQVKPLNRRGERIMEWYDEYLKGKNKLSNKLKSEIKKKLMEEDKNADV